MNNEVKNLKDLLSQCRPYVNHSKLGHAIDLLQSINETIGNPAEYQLGDEVYYWIDSDLYANHIGDIEIYRDCVEAIHKSDKNKFSYEFKQREGMISEEHLFSSIVEAKMYMLGKIGEIDNE